MNGFIFETLTGRGWRKSGPVYWTRHDAEKSALMLIRQKAARSIRILPVSVNETPVVVIPNEEGTK